MRNISFWTKLKKPFFVLAPMADVTDPPFRTIIAGLGKPDVMFTEFVSCDGLVSEGKERILKDLRYTKKEKPIVAQVFGSRPENFMESAKIIKELGFDGIDINMGCPDKSVERQGAGAALIRNPKLAEDIIKHTKKGAGDMPVSVKTRIGYNKLGIEDWLPVLLEAEPAAISIHARTRRELSKSSARWDVLKRAVEIRNASNYNSLIIGNGDVENLCEARTKAEESGVDGVMLGRAILGNPWLFCKNTDKKNMGLDEILKVLVSHIEEYDKLMEGVKSFAVMKKHFKAYINGFSGAKDLRASLMDADTAEDAIKVITNFELKK